MNVLALDVGGANLKAADGLGFAATRPFALWRRPEQLAAEIQSLVASAPPCERIVATMTGELADCYESKADGVRAIVDALESAAGGRALSVYLIDGRLAAPADVRAAPHLAAASNWHALATFAARFLPASPGVIVDMGSTTTDILPVDPQAASRAPKSDAERLLQGELVYTGVARTPLCAVVNRLPWRGEPSPMAAELFATTADAYVLLGDLPEDADDVDTADGRPRTRAAARARLARMTCRDASDMTDDDALAAAAAIREAQLHALTAALTLVSAELGQLPAGAVICGQGEFLLAQLFGRLPWRAPCQVVSMKEKLGDDVSRCAPAHALATLVREGHFAS
jgi:probable H4MPT-linked C1 transfer pathway protein